MHDNNSVETVLARLMPPSLSMACQREIETMLDELADSGATPQPSARPVRRWIIGGGLAAAVALALTVARLISPPTPATAVATNAPEFRLISESDRIESMTDEGWREVPDGSAMRAMRVRLVEQTRLFDEETGIVMQVFQPREELLLMPISAF